MLRLISRENINISQTLLNYLKKSFLIYVYRQAFVEGVLNHLLVSFKHMVWSESDIVKIWKSYDDEVCVLLMLDQTKAKSIALQVYLFHRSDPDFEQMVHLREMTCH